MSNTDYDNAKPSPTAGVSRRDLLQMSGAAALSLASGLMLRVGQAHPSASHRKIRMGVVGGGFGTQFYWNEHPNCVVNGVTDLRPDRLQKLQQTYQCDQTYDSLEQMVDQAKDIDAVAIFTGAPDHFKHAKMCLERGWHVITAVPACCTLEEAAALKEIVERTGLGYMMAETSYYRPECIFARELFKKGLLGNIFYTEGEYYHDRGDLSRLLTNKKSIFYDPDGSRSWRWGFPKMWYPTHATAYVVGVTGERMTKVSCLGWGTGDHPFVTDNAYDNPFWNAASLMQTSGGNMCRMNVFGLCAAAGERAQWYGDKATFYMPKAGVHKATLRFRTKGDTPTRYDLPEQSGGDIQVPVYWNTDMLPEAMRHESGHGDSHTFIAAEFINALVEERPPAIDLYESLAMTVPGIVAHESCLKDGEQLTIPQFDRKRG